MKKIKTAVALLLFAAVGTTACGPQTPSRTVPLRNDSSGGSSQDTTIPRSTSTLKKTNTLKATSVQRISTATSDSSGGSSQDTTKH